MSAGSPQRDRSRDRGRTFKVTGKSDAEFVQVRNQLRSAFAPERFHFSPVAGSDPYGGVDIEDGNH